MEAKNDQQQTTISDGELEGISGGGALPELHSSSLESVASPLFEKGMDRYAVYDELVKRGVIKPQQDYFISDKQTNLMDYLLEMQSCYDGTAQQVYYYD